MCGVHHPCGVYQVKLQLLHRDIPDEHQSDRSMGPEVDGHGRVLTNATDLFDRPHTILLVVNHIPYHQFQR